MRNLTSGILKTNTMLARDTTFDKEVHTHFSMALTTHGHSALATDCVYPWRRKRRRAFGASWNKTTARCKLGFVRTKLGAGWLVELPWKKICYTTTIEIQIARTNGIWMHQLSSESCVASQLELLQQTCSTGYYQCS